MQESNEFLIPSSSSTYLISSNLHVQTQDEGSLGGSRIVYVTNYNQNHANLSGDFEDSHDTYFNSDTEDVSISEDINQSSYVGKTPSMITALQKAIDSQNKAGEKLHKDKIVPEMTVQDELKCLMEEVKNDSSIHKQSSKCLDIADSPKFLDILTSDVPSIEVLEEPEQTYRARYESEGCKGPIHGATETGYPTIKIRGYVGKIIISVYVVTRDNEPHLHAATGPGSSKTPGIEVKHTNGCQAIQMVMQPVDENDEMTVVFDQLSIRRVRNWEADHDLRERGIDPTSWKNKKKEAKLAFDAKIPSTPSHPGYMLLAYSRPFQCTAPSGNPEIHWSSLTESLPTGGKEMGFLGKKFASGFKIRFFSKEDDGRTWEAFAEIDKNKSCLYGCVFKVPSYMKERLRENVSVYIEVRVGPEKEPRTSDPITFTYLAATEEDCKKCQHVQCFIHAIQGVLNGKKELCEIVNSFNSIINSDIEVSNSETLKCLATDSSGVKTTLPSVKTSSNVIEMDSSRPIDLKTLLMQPNCHLVTPSVISSPINTGSNYHGIMSTTTQKSNAMEVDSRCYNLPVTTSLLLKKPISPTSLFNLVASSNLNVTPFLSSVTAACSSTSHHVLMPTSEHQHSKYLPNDIFSQPKCLSVINPMQMSSCTNSIHPASNICSQVNSVIPSPVFQSTSTTYPKFETGVPIVYSSPKFHDNMHISFSPSKVQSRVPAGYPPHNLQAIDIERQINSHIQEVKNLQRQLQFTQSSEFSGDKQAHTAYGRLKIQSQQPPPVQSYGHTLHTPTCQSNNLLPNSSLYASYSFQTTDVHCHTSTPNQGTFQDTLVPLCLNNTQPKLQNNSTFGQSAISPHVLTSMQHPQKQQQLILQQQSKPVQVLQQQPLQVPQNIQQVSQNFQQVPQNIEQVPQNIQQVSQNIQQASQNIQQVPQNIQQVQQNIQQLPLKQATQNIQCQLSPQIQQVQQQQQQHLQIENQIQQQQHRQIENQIQQQQKLQIHHQQLQQQIQQEYLSNIMNQNSTSNFVSSQQHSAWHERRPTIHDAIATNKIGYYKSPIEEVTQPRAMEQTSDSVSFLDTYQQHVSHSSPSFSTPPLTPSSSSFNMLSNPIDSSIQTFSNIDQKPFSQAKIPTNMDYSISNSSFQHTAMDTVQKEESSQDQLLFSKLLSKRRLIAKFRESTKGY